MFVGNSFLTEREQQQTAKVYRVSRVLSEKKQNYSCLLTLFQSYRHNEYNKIESSIAYLQFCVWKLKKKKSFRVTLWLWVVTKQQRLLFCIFEFNEPKSDDQMKRKEQKDIFPMKSSE